MGADTPAVIFDPEEKLRERKEAGKAFRLFFLGQRLTEFVKMGKAAGWANAPKNPTACRKRPRLRPTA